MKQEMELLPMTDFILEQKQTKISEQDLSFSDRELRKLKRINSYAKFLQQKI